MTEEPTSLILELLRQMRAEMATKADFADLVTKPEFSAQLTSLRAHVAADMHTLRADVAADILSTRKELSEQIVGLRRAVIDYRPRGDH